MDGRLLLPYRGTYYVLSGESNSVNKDNLSKKQDNSEPIKENLSKKKEKRRSNK